MNEFKVGDVLDAPELKIYIVLDRIFYLNETVAYYNFRYFYDTRDVYQRITPHLVTFTPGDLERYVLTKIDV